MHDVTVLVDFPDGSRRFRQPRAVLAAADVQDVRPLLREVEAQCRAGRWAVGFVGYEAAPAFDTALAVRDAERPLPLAWFALFDAPDDAPVRDAADAAPAPLAWRTDMTAAEHAEAVAEIRRRIAAGDVYQVNHTLRFTADLPGDFDARAMYDALVQSRQGLYHAFIDTGDWCIVSASPELFIATENDAGGVRIRTRPMKGTHRRGRWLEEDTRAAAALAASEKDRAENLMIVDLLRNDLGRVARFGSVAVKNLFRVETFPTVHQMTTEVSALLREDTSLDDVFAATFPCGSVTGAPKFTAMKGIRDLERSPRGVYCGAIGIVRPDCTFTFNVGIRTLVVDRERARATYGSGSGITWDSHADAEYDEIAAKAALLGGGTPEFSLLETLRVEDGSAVRLDRHLARLHDSAQYWDFPPEIAERARHAVMRALQDAQRGDAQQHGEAKEREDAQRRDEAQQQNKTTLRLRLLAHRSGDVEVTVDGIPPVPQDVTSSCGRPRTAFAAERVQSSDPLLFHKTTARALHDRLRASRDDVWDVLLCNEREEVTEFTIGNVVVEIDGVWLTPPREAGLLAGCMRAELLDSGRVTERTLHRDDVVRASRVWLVNSLRGMVEVAVE